MVKTFKIGTVVKQSSDSKLLDNHIEQGLQDETQDKSDSGGSSDPEPTRPSAIDKMPASPSKLSPTLQLIKELEAYQRTPEDERWHVRYGQKRRHLKMLMSSFNILTSLQFQHR